MQIRLLSSHSSGGPDERPRHPSHLPGDLSAALRELGHQVEVSLLGDALGGHEPSTLSEGALAGRKLAAELVGKLAGPQSSDGGTDRVLHALDPVAWAAALTARSRVDVAVVLRFTGQPASHHPADGDPSPGLPPLTESLTERRAQRACLRAADAIAATADGDRLAAVHAGVPGDRALVVPDLVAPPSGLPSGKPRSPGSLLVSLGGIGPGSGIEAALVTMRSLPGRELVVAGLGGEADALAFWLAVRKLGLEHRVRWLGWLDRPATARLIDSAALVLCLSPLAGAVGAIETMSRSRAVVAVAGGRAAEVVVDGITGAVLPNDHSAPIAAVLRTLLKNPFQLEAMGLAGRERAQALFAPDRAVLATERAYRVALGAA